MRIVIARRNEVITYEGVDLIYFVPENGIMEDIDDLVVKENRKVLILNMKFISEVEITEG